MMTVIAKIKSFTANAPPNESADFRNIEFQLCGFAQAFNKYFCQKSIEWMRPYSTLAFTGLILPLNLHLDWHKIATFMKDLEPLSLTDQD